MPLFIAALWGGLLQVAGTLVGRVVLALGFTYVSYTGLSSLLGNAESLVRNGLQGMPSDAVVFFAWMKIDKAISMIFGAMGSSFLIKGMNGGSISKMVLKTKA